MRQIEFTAPNTHPYVVTLFLDPALYDRLKRFAQDTKAFRILGCNRSQPEAWQVAIGCASELVAERIEEGWG